jgi:hypothetical protein
MGRLSTKLLSKAEMPVYIETSCSMADTCDSVGQVDLFDQSAIT